MSLNIGPVNNSNVASSSTATNDDHGGDPGLSELSSIEKTFKEVSDYFSCQIHELRTTGSSKKERDKLRMTVDKFESQIPKNYKMQSMGYKYENPWSDKSNKGSNQAYVNEVSPPAELRNKDHKYFEDAAAVEAFFDRLPVEKQLSLLCLLKFPENAIIKKRLIVYWWIGMGILSNSWTTEEDFGNQLFDEHIQRDFIEPLSQKGNSVVDSCAIRPLVHSTLTKLAAERPEFKQHGTECEEFLCLPNFGLATLYEKPEQVLITKEAKILHLGRWLSSASKHHIEVESIKIFDGLKNMKLNLTFLSLRGISLITELPGFISELDNLKILDLRACHNLESLPDGIGLLQKLTHLDMSECYFLEHMPKALASLLKLQVLKGFFIGKTDNNNCTLSDLARLQKLRKLNVYTSVKGFPTANELKDLSRFPILRKLTISWGGCSFGKTEVNSSESTSSQEQLPSMLKKLDLQCYPWTSAPGWLKTEEPSSLEKLYIRGGHLRDLPNLWSVEKLHLKYLSELDMDWGKQRESFPNLNYLEIVDCPKVTGLREGVWMKSDDGTYQGTKLNKRSRILNVLHKVFR